MAPNLRLYFANANFLRANPIGIESQNRLILQKRLSDSESPLFRDTFINGGVAVKLNPAATRVGAEVGFQPIAVFNLKATAEYARYFGLFGFLQSYPNPLADFSDDSRSTTEDSAYSTNGMHFMLEPTLQAKVSNFVVRSKVSIEYWNVDLKEGDTAAFYDAFLDTLVPGKGWVFTNDSDLMMLASPQLTLGARFSAVWPQYDEAGAGAVKPDNSHMRIGALAAYAFHRARARRQPAHALRQRRVVPQAPEPRGRDAVHRHRLLLHLRPARRKIASRRTGVPVARSLSPGTCHGLRPFGPEGRAVRASRPRRGRRRSWSWSARGPGRARGRARALPPSRRAPRAP